MQDAMSEFTLGSDLGQPTGEFGFRAGIRVGLEELREAFKNRPQCQTADASDAHGRFYDLLRKFVVGKHQVRER
jgi:hypothetical protein